MNDTTTIETECEAARVRISVRMTPEGIAAGLDALKTAEEVLCDLFRRRGWVPPAIVNDEPPPQPPAVKRKGAQP